MSEEISMSRREDGYVLQVVEIVSEREPIIIRGLVFASISVGDCLSINAVEDDSELFILENIEAYGKSFKQSERGDQAEFTLSGQAEMKFNSDERYLYLYRVDVVSN